MSKARQIADFNFANAGTGGLPAWIVKSAAYTAVNKDRIIADTTLTTFTITLPANPTAGMEVTITDLDGTFGTHGLVIDRNGSNITGLTENLSIDVAGALVNLVYVNATVGWIITSSSSASQGSGLSPWAIHTADYTASNKDRIFADTSAAAFTITLPANPTAGMEVTIADLAGTFGTNNLTVARNDSPIMSDTQDLTLDVSNDSVNLAYTDATRGWVLTK